MTTRETPTTPPTADGAPDLTAVVAAHPFTLGFDDEHVRMLAGLASTVAFERGRFLFLHGQPADRFFLLTTGDVALEIASPGSPPMVLATVHPGDALGWSWLYAPFRWHLDAHATSAVEALAFDAGRLRALLAEDPEFGREVSHRMGGLLVERLKQARSQLVSARAP